MVTLPAVPYGTCETRPMTKTVVHVLRHGEVHNPAGVLYGRLPGYRLSDTGMEMARRVGQWLAGELNEPRRDITYVAASPLLRAQQTAAPTAHAFGLSIACEPRAIEAGSRFEGMTFGVGDGSMFHPSHWHLLRNPFRPSWGEPYRQIVARMSPAIHDAAATAAGHEALLVSHQLPIWIVRCAFEGRRLFHDPRSRQCAIASLTSFHFDDGTFTHCTYTEPARDLIAPHQGVFTPPGKA